MQNITINYPPKNIAVLMATYNGSRWLLEQLSSILRQDDVTVQIFVSDDISTDQTWSLLQSISDDRITLLPRGQKFCSAAKNFFRLMRDVDISKYDFVAYADQDDIWESNKLKLSVDTIMSKSVDAFSSNVIAFWPDGNKKIISKSQKQQNWDYLFQSGGPGCTYVLSKKLAIELKKFLCEHEDKAAKIALHDWLIYAFARCRGYRWWIESRATMYYRQHESNEFGANNGLKAAFSRWEKLVNGWYRNQVLLIADILGVNDVWPIVRMRKYRWVDRLALITNVLKLRRRKLECISLAFALLLPSKHTTDLNYYNNNHE